MKPQTPPVIDPSLNLDQVRRECQDMVKKRARLSAGAAMIPVPFLDVMVDAGLLSQLLPEISERFGLSQQRMPAYDPTTRQLQWKVIFDRLTEFGGFVLTRGVVRKSIQGLGGRIVATQVAKFIPLGGQMVAAGLSYFVLKKIAEDHINDCYSMAKQLQTKGRATHL